MKNLTLNTNIGNLAANLYLPEHVEKPPVVIVTGAWTTVKEQMPHTYAQALIKQGYAALTFDFRGWGQSPDTVKYLEDPARKIEDIKAVIETVSQLSEIDSKNIMGLGICASSGYMLDAASTNNKIKAVAVVAPWLHNLTIAEQIYGGTESVQSLITASKSAVQNAKPTYLEAASTTNEQSLMFQAPYYTETNRGLIAEYDNQFNVASWKPWLTYDAQVGAKTQDKPVLIVASESMALPAGAHLYLENSNSNVSAIWLDNITQFDFYDVPAPVNSAIEATLTHFNKHL